MEAENSLPSSSPELKPQASHGKNPNWLFLFIPLLIIVIVGLFYLKQNPQTSIVPVATPLTQTDGVTQQVPVKAEVSSSTPSATLGQPNLGVKLNVGSYKNNKISGTVDISNSSLLGAGDISYTVTLVTPPTQTTQVVNGKTTNVLVPGDTIAYTESQNFDLNSGQKKTFNFDLSYTSHLKPGTYTVFATAVSNLGKPLGSDIYKAQLTGSDDMVTFNPDDCKVIINSKEFFPLAGAIVDPKGLAEGRCSFTNPTSQSLTLTYTNTVAQLHVVGYPGSDAQTQSSNPKITFGPKETKTITFTLPTDFNPQVYESYIYLVDSSGQVQSTPAIFRWTIKGESGRIETISLDKDSYTNGQTAKISMTIDPSMDLWWRQYDPKSGTELTNPQVQVALYSGNLLCGQQVFDVSPLLSPKVVTVNLPVRENCSNPNVQAKLLSNNQAVASANSKLLTPVASNPTTAPTQAQPATQSIPVLPVAVIIVLIVAGVLVFVLRKNKPGSPGSPTMMVLLLIGATAIAGYLITSSVKADVVPVASNPTDGYLIGTPYQNSGGDSPATISPYAHFYGSGSVTGSTLSIDLWGNAYYDFWCANLNSGRLAYSVTIQGQGIPGGSVSVLGDSTTFAWTYPTIKINNPAAGPLTYTFSIPGTSGTLTFTVPVVPPDTTPPTVSISGFPPPGVTCFSAPGTGTNAIDSPGNNISANADDPGTPSNGVQSVTFTVKDLTKGIPAGIINASTTATVPCHNCAWTGSLSSISSNLVSGDLYQVTAVASDGTNTSTPTTPSATFTYDTNTPACVAPYLQTGSGDVHSNQRISTPGGPQ